jgi:hypothetical protein
VQWQITVRKLFAVCKVQEKSAQFVKIVSRDDIQGLYHTTIISALLCVFSLYARLRDLRSSFAVSFGGTSSHKKEGHYGIAIYSEFSRSSDGISPTLVKNL